MAIAALVRWILGLHRSGASFVLYR